MPYAIMEQQDAPGLRVDNLLHRAGVDFLTYSFRQTDGTAVAARNHHHIAHVRLRLVGQVEAGRRDLLIAAALEPNRAIFRRYLSENFSTVGGGTTTPMQPNPRPEKTSKPKSHNAQTTPRPEKKTASSKPRSVQTTPPPQIATAPTPYPAQPPPIQIGIGIGRGQRYYPPPRHITPSPPSEGSGHQQGDHHPPKTPPPHGDFNQRGQTQPQHTGGNKSPQRRKSTSQSVPR